MISIPYPRVKNSKTIELLPQIAPVLTTAIPVLRRAYRFYRVNKGNPSIIIPLNKKSPGAISAIQEEALSGLYRTTYKKLKENYRELDWAYDLRKADHLPHCPMCGNTGRDALDHYLAKADYPEFAILSFNLVPTCTSCNSRRSNQANAPGTALPLLHPYFEGPKLNSPLVTVMIDQDYPLPARPTFEMPSFQLAPAIPFTDPLFPRLENHLRRCVDESQFRRWVTGRWKLWRIKAPAYRTVIALRDAITIELDAEIDVGGVNNWTAAFLRGLYACTPAMEWLIANPA